MKSFKIQSINTVYKGFFETNVIHFKHSLYQGGWTDTFSREVFNRGQAVVVLLYDSVAKQIVLVEQCRAGAVLNAQSTQTLSDAWLLEPIAGMIDSGESAIEAGIRETQEEAGVLIHDLEFICQYYPSPGGCNEILHLYATDISGLTVAEFAGLDSENEDIKIVTLSYKKAKQMLLNAEFNVAATYIALQWLFFQKIRGGE